MGSRTSSGHPTEGFHVCGGKLNSALTPRQHCIRCSSTRLFRPACLTFCFLKDPRTHPLFALTHDYAIPLHLPSTCHELPILFISTQPLHTPALIFKRLPINACILLLTTPLISYAMLKATATSRTSFSVVSCLG